MKKLIFLLIPILLCGCTHDMNRKEIDEINLVLVLGIDYIEGEYTLSALYSTGSGADPEKSAGTGDEEVANGKGRSPYEALEDLKLNNKKAISLAQTGSFLIGEGAAKQGLKQTLDFLTRDETIKMEALVYVIKEKSAADFIKEGIENKQTIHDDLEAIKQKQQERLTRNDNTFVNIQNDCLQTDSCVLIPYLILEESGFKITGYAVFQDFRLRDYLDEDTSNGVNFLKNIMRSYPIYLEDEIGVLISYTKTKLKAKVKNNGITVIIQVNFETMLKEVTTEENIFTQDNLLRLTKKQNEQLLILLEKPVNYSVNNGLDIFNLARLVENQNVKEWKQVKGDWPAKISKITYEYDIKSQITKSFVLGNIR